MHKEDLASTLSGGVPNAEATALRDAADNALGVLIRCCVPAGGVDDRDAILDTQTQLRAALAQWKEEQ